MLRRSWLVGLVCMVAGLRGGIAAAVDTPAEATKPTRILFVTQSQGFRHGSVTRPANALAPAEIALTQLGQQTGLFDVDCTQDVASDFTKANLQHYDIVAFYTTGDLPIAQEDRDYFFNEWLKEAGHGVLGFHSAADTFHNYEPYYTMINGTFIGHPWGAGSTVTLTNHEPDNVLVQPFGAEFVIKDEIYMYRNHNPETVRVLLSLDYSRSPTGGKVNAKHGYHVPVCWIRTWGEGTVYFNNLGHNDASWTNEAYLASITNAVKWIRGMAEADATPNPAVSEAQEAKSKADAKAGNFNVEE
ncbi:MAG: ThuA domain-containing protein [Planctomycetaceae bacterium]